MKNENTERGVLNTGVYWGEKGRASGRERWGGIAWGEMPNVGEGEKERKERQNYAEQKLLCKHCVIHFNNTLKSSVVLLENRKRERTSDFKKCLCI